MRLAAIASALAIILCAAVFGTIFLQRTSVSGPTAPALAAPGEGQAPAIGASARADAMKAAVVEQTEAPTVVAQAGPAPAPTTCSNPNALGIARTVEIDTTGGPGFGFLQYKQFDFLTDKEVVLTFDDGPWPTTPAVLKALADECTKGLFFPVGKHTTYHPEILKQVFAAGHTVGSHTWSHAHLDSKKLTEAQVKEEIEKGFSAVKMALGTAPAPFFRFPGLGHTQAALGYLASRNISMFSVDVDSNDFKSSGPDQVINNVMTKLDKQGKGVILMHDLQKHTAIALPTLLRRLKAGGYKVVQMKAKEQLETLPEYDALLVKDQKTPAVASRPISSVVQTVSQ